MAVSTCAHYAPPWAYFGWEPEPPPCGRPAAILLRTACVHEHVDERGMCAEHEAIMRASRALACKPCRDGPRPHECPLTLQWAPLEMAA